MSELKLNTTWSKGLSEEEVIELRSNISSSQFLRRRIISILEEKIQKAVSESISKDALDRNNWALRQADNCGYRRGLEEFKTLISKLS